MGTVEEEMESKKNNEKRGQNKYFGSFLDTAFAFRFLAERWASEGISFHPAVRTQLKVPLQSKSSLGVLFLDSWAFGTVSIILFMLLVNV